MDKKLSDIATPLEALGDINTSAKILHDIAIDRGILRDVVYIDHRLESRGKPVTVPNVIVGSMAELIALDAELSREHFLGRQGLK